VLGQLEREPGEYVVDPWVTVRHTIVAVHRERIAGAAHLLRYADDERVNPSLRGAGEIRWLLFWPGQNPAGAVEMVEVADALAAAATAHLRGCTRIGADFGLPAPAVYGVADRWPHLAVALSRAGFVADDRVEAVLAAAIEDLPSGGVTPIPDVELRIALGGHGTRFSAVLDGRVIGMYEADTDLTQGGTRTRLAGWADGWELWTAPEHRRRGLATWLLGHAADRMRFAGVRRVLDYATIAPGAPDGTLAFLHRVGFRELTRTTRAWTLQ
jgi:GNAT superfamily N-acetyltransferase